MSMNTIYKTQEQRDLYREILKLKNYNSGLRKRYIEREIKITNLTFKLNKLLSEKQKLKLKKKNKKTTLVK